VAGHQVVGGVGPRTGEDAHRRERAPRPAQRVRDHERRGRAVVEHRRTPPVVREHIERGEVRGPAAERRQHPGRRSALERGEMERALPVAREDEAHRPVAEPALAVVKQQMWPLHRRLSHGIIMNVFTDNGKPRKRGRPPGLTAEGEAARKRLYRTAIALIGERGYEATTLRAVAARAGVSPALLYRYFPNKRALVMAL